MTSRSVRGGSTSIDGYDTDGGCITFERNVKSFLSIKIDLSKA